MASFTKPRILQVAVCQVVSTVFLFVTSAAYAQVEILDGSIVFLTTNETVIGKKSRAAVGQIVPSRVWRDVLIDGHVVIKAGTPATVKIATLKGRAIFGIKGKMSMTAVETKTVDNQTVYLTGGYHKEGKSRMALSLGVGLLLLWPFLFVPGKAAELPAGTVMETYTQGSIIVAIAETEKQIRTVSLGAIMSDFDVQVLYDELTKVDKPKYFDFQISAPVNAPDEYVIDKINGSSVEALKLEFVSSEILEDDVQKSVRAKIKIKPLAKQFKKGINTFDVSYMDSENERVAQEVLLRIEM